MCGEACRAELGVADGGLRTDVLFFPPPLCADNTGDALLAETTSPTPPCKSVTPATDTASAARADVAEGAAAFFMAPPRLLGGLAAALAAGGVAGAAASVAHDGRAAVVTLAPKWGLTGAARIFAASTSALSSCSSCCFRKSAALAA